ncbi:hypothetical protein NL676_019383 [Syzygium grande]|nr:hypothetical protein NL676_019383 [Syzygium grande]
MIFLIFLLSSSDLQGVTVVLVEKLWMLAGHDMDRWTLARRWMDELSFATMGEARSRRATMEPNVSDDRHVDWADCKQRWKGWRWWRHLPPPPPIESFAFHRESSEPHSRSSSGRVIGDRAANIVGFDNLENNDFELADSVMPFGGEKRDQGHRLKELRSIGPSRMVRIGGCLVAAVYIRQ